MSEWFCRFYSVLLYAYPAAFRREFGGPMRQAFRDQCRQAARRSGLWRFAGRAMADWCSSAARERVAAFWSAGRRKAPRGQVAEWAATVLVYLFATTTLVQAYVIPTGSMEGNLLIGDHVLVDRLAFGKPGPLGSVLPYREVRNGDIVAFLYPEDPRQTYVKRVIGVPGDRIRIERGTVIRNGRPLKEPYARRSADDFPAGPSAWTTARGRQMLERHVSNGELLVPPGTLFALGDNRGHSADSRYWGLVPQENVLGKPLVVYWSYDAPTEHLVEWSAEHAIDVAVHFFSKTRWRRMLLVPRSEKAVEE